MADPFREHAADKKAKRREKIRDTHTPIVLWVKPPDGEGAGDVRKKLKEYVNEDLPYVTAATYPEPYGYAESGVLREEDADGL